MADVARARRLSGRIKQIVATMIEGHIKDPRLGMVTITDVRVTGDLHDATIFYTVFGGEDERAASAAALESARGVLRSEVGRQTGVRFTPTLTFVPGRAARCRAPAGGTAGRHGRGRRPVGGHPRGRDAGGRGRPVPQAPRHRRRRTGRGGRRRRVGQLRGQALDRPLTPHVFGPCDMGRCPAT